MTTPSHEPLLASLDRQIAAEQQLVLAEAAIIRARSARDELRGAQHMLARLMQSQAAEPAAPEAPKAPEAPHTPEEPAEQPTITTGTEEA